MFIVFILWLFIIQSLYFFIFCIIKRSFCVRFIPLFSLSIYSLQFPPCREKIAWLYLFLWHQNQQLFLACIWQRWGESVTFITSGNVHWYNLSWKQFWCFYKIYKLNFHLLFDHETPCNISKQKKEEKTFVPYVPFSIINNSQDLEAIRAKFKLFLIIDY